MINYSSSIESTNTICTHRLPQQQTKTQCRPDLLKTIRTMLDRRCILLPIHLFHIHLTLDFDLDPARFIGDAFTFFGTRDTGVAFGWDSLDT